jgi:lipopolysaccharide export LptBFGC system permease protein LptF
MPWTLYRYILRELLKVLVLTTAVMVVVLSFGAAIGPMSDGLLGPVSLIKFVLYTIPTVLGFALPFAGAFSATVVFHTMTKDNEVLACRAGGMSYSRIFAPVVALGLVLMLVLLLLSNTIVPGFWKAAKRTVEGDVLGILVSQLNQSRPYEFGDGLVLYADAAEMREPPPGSSAGGLKAEQLIVMTDIAVGTIDRQTGQVTSDTTASHASALLVRDALGKSYISLKLINPIHLNVEGDELQSDIGQSDVAETSQPIELPNPIEDEAVFFTFEDLMRLKRRPHDFDMVRSAQADLAAAVSRQQLTHLIRRALTDEGRGDGFVRLKGGLRNEYYRLSARDVELDDGVLVLTGDDAYPVVVERFDNAELNGEAVRKFDAHLAHVEIKTGQFDREPEVTVTLKRTEDRFVRVLSLIGEDLATEKDEQVIGPMRYTERVLGVDPATLSAEQLNDWSQREQIKDAEGVRQARAWLRFRIIQLKYMIDAELYARLATALATPLLLLLGTLLAVRLRDKLPLVVFFWAFVLAIVTLVMIHTGQSMAERITIEQVQAGRGLDRAIGVAVLWGGNVALLLVNARLYLRIARN